MKAPITPDRTSPVPAVASRGEPAAASRTPGRLAVRRARAATAVRRPLSRTTAPVALGERPRGGDAVGPGRRTGQAGVLAVVGREHDRTAAPRDPDTTDAASVDRAQGEERVGVGDHRDR